MDENEHRVPLSQFELAQSVKKRYDVLSEDLVGEEESVECPECGKECEGRESIVQHWSQASEHPDHPVAESASGFNYTKEKDIHKEIADNSSFEISTVRQLIDVASIPEQFQPFVKIPEERSSQEEDRVEENENVV